MQIYANTGFNVRQVAGGKWRLMTATLIANAAAAHYYFENECDTKK
jgi:hypothetical protein